ncbi:hypothetical protein AC26_1719 [Escherichia coli 1-176-05_S3_C2]|nr:hypothetical protein AC26_1719 [Escherichia coli 1-176-05_S3_C2]
MFCRLMGEEKERVKGRFNRPFLRLELRKKINIGLWIL